MRTVSLGLNGSRQLRTGFFCIGWALGVPGRCSVQTLEQLWTVQKARHFRNLRLDGLLGDDTAVYTEDAPGKPYRNRQWLLKADFSRLPPAVRTAGYVAAHRG